MLNSDVLNSIGRKQGTDKTGGAEGTHDFLRKYEFFLEPFKDQDITLLELGVYKGGSLRTWAEHFPKARIVGVDIEEDCLSQADGRIEVIIGDLSQSAFLESLALLLPTIVIDDASHWWPDQLRALFILYPALAPGSIYIIEDVHTSFEPLAPLFSCDLDTPPFKFLMKLSEYMTGDDQKAPVVDKGALVPLERDPKFDKELRYLADLTDAVIFIKRAVILIRK
ncbi:MAG: class I SAM-dependent methyltransferase [Deltaproteobacteria bacterium]|jgi:hypothetical protein|nr:class I SAM-dependent methyltransferase [Deltaproteobacteria bacterium]